MREGELGSSDLRQGPKSRAVFGKYNFVSFFGFVDKPMYLAQICGPCNVVLSLIP